MKKKDKAYYKAKNVRGTDGGVYLVYVCGSTESDVALRYAASIAVQSRSNLAVLGVIEQDGFQHWNDLELRIQKEKRMEMEKYLKECCSRVYEEFAIIPCIYIKEGVAKEVIVETINHFTDIREFLIGGSKKPGDPGVLVSYFALKGLSQLRVPLTIIPEHLHDIEQL